MRVFDETTKADIKAAIEEAEKNSSCEVVAIVTQRSGEYLIYGLFAAAVAALTLPQAAYVFVGLGSADVIKMQIVAFMLFAMLAYLPRINILFTPKKTKERRARILAQSGFFRVGLHGTTHRHSLMLFVSLDEKYVEILADAEIVDKLSLSAFEAIKSELANAVGKKKFADTYISTIKTCGAMLAEKFPSDGSRANELIDGVVELNE